MHIPGSLASQNVHATTSTLNASLKSSIEHQRALSVPGQHHRLLLLFLEMTEDSEGEVSCPGYLLPSDPVSSGHPETNWPCQHCRPWSRQPWMSQQKTDIWRRPQLSAMPVRVIAPGRQPIAASPKMFSGLPPQLYASQNSWCCLHAPCSQQC